MTRIDDRMLSLYKLDGDTSFLVGGSELIDTIELDKREGIGKVMIFYDPYTETKVDVVFYENGYYRGTLWISEPYGTTMEREKIRYFHDCEGRERYERF